MVGCGAYDIGALNTFDNPAAKVRHIQGNPIATSDDLLNGIVKEVNQEAEKRGKEALDLL